MLAVFLWWTVGASVPAASEEAPADPLPSWAEGPAKAAVIGFVARVTQAGGADFVEPAERIATFDNDGTLWAEQPNYVQGFFLFDRIKALAPRHPEWKKKQPYAALLEGDVKRALGGGQKPLVEMLMATHAGMSSAEFESIVEEWIGKARHPRFRRPFIECV